MTVLKRKKSTQWEKAQQRINVSPIVSRISRLMTVLKRKKSTQWEKAQQR